MNTVLRCSNSTLTVLKRSLYSENKKYKLPIITESQNSILTALADGQLFPWKSCPPSILHDQNDEGTALLKL